MGILLFKPLEPMIIKSATLLGQSLFEKEPILDAGAARVQISFESLECPDLIKH